MAVVLTDFAPYKIVNDASTPGVATKVTLPSGAVGFDALAEVDEGQYSNTGTDAVALGDNYMSLEIGRYVRVPTPPEVYGNPPVVYFGHDDTSGVVRIVPLFSRFPAGVQAVAELRIDDELPLFIQREKAATLLLEAYLGDVATPSTATVGTFTLARPAGTLLLDAQACGVVTHTATYALSAIADTEDYGDKWVATWAVTIGGVVYEVEQRAMLVRQVLRCPVTNATLLRVHPSLTTYPAGHSSWEPTAIHDAWVWTQQCLIETGMRPYKVIGADALERMTRYKALGLAAREIATFSGDPERWTALADKYDREPFGDEAPGLAQQAWAKVRPYYDADDDGVVTDDEREDDQHASGWVF